MFIFEWGTAYLIMFILYFLPGLFFIFYKINNLNILEKFLFGAITSFIAQAIFVSIISYFLGAISLVSIALSYILYILVLLYLSYKLKAFNNSLEFNIKDTPIYLILLILIISNWNLRIFSFSPIYYEFDPYFYLDGVKYLLNYGVIPKLDDSAWNPYNVSTHRNPPLYHYVIGTWYYLIYGGNVDDIKLSAVANLYPPINAVFMIISFYLLSKILIQNTWIAFFIAYFISLIPIFILKFQAGVFEYQPYNFFIFSFLITSLFLAVKLRNEVVYLALLIAYSGVIMGAVASPAIILVFLLSLALFMIKYGKQLEEMYKYISLTLLAGVFMYIYNDAVSRLIFASIPLMIYIFIKLYPYIKSINFNNINYMLGGLVLLAVFIGGFLFKDILLYAMQYNNPLERTIAEQNPSGPNLDDNFGKLGIGSNRIDRAMAIFINLIAYLPTVILNFLFGSLFGVLSFFDLVVEWSNKEVSLAYAALFYAMLFYVYEFISMFKSKKELSDGLIISFPMLIFSIGLLKAKFEIYFTFGFLFIFIYLIERLLRMVENFNNSNLTNIFVIFISSILILSSGYGGVSAIDTLTNFLKSNFMKPISQDLNKVEELVGIICNNNPEFPDCNSSISITTQYSRLLCNLDLRFNRMNDMSYNIMYSTSCNHIPLEWYSAMMFIKDSTEPDSIITSWWDYGHWINYWGNRRATIRNDHSVLSMILDVAYAYIIGNETVLKEVLNKYNSKYALFDSEIIFGGETLFGGKFYALNYLACAKINQVNQKFPMMSSLCETNNLWEVVLISNERCNIKNRLGRVGYVVEYEGYTGSLNNKLLRKYCVVNNDGSLDLSRIENNVVKVFLSNIQYILYDLNTSKLHKAIPIQINQNVLVNLYTYDKAWFMDGEWVDGYNDATKPFYKSTIYRAFILEKLDGFDLVFNNRYVKIYRLKE